MHIRLENWESLWHNCWCEKIIFINIDQKILRKVSCGKCKCHKFLFLPFYTKSGQTVTVKLLFMSQISNLTIFLCVLCNFETKRLFAVKVTCIPKQTGDHPHVKYFLTLFSISWKCVNKVKNLLFSACKEFLPAAFGKKAGSQA